MEATKNYNKIIFKVKFKRWCLSFLFVLLAILLSSFVINRFISPVVKKSINAQVNYIVTKRINEVIIDTIAKENITYDKLVVIEKTSNNMMSGLISNMPLINILKSRLAIDTNEAINEIGIEELSIPIGSLFGNEFFSARGPNVHFKILYAGMTNVDINSSFETAGINQTKHTINSLVNVSIGIVLKGYKSNIDIETKVPIAETIIIGNIPNYYINGKGQLPIQSAE
ncbi:MAG: sporulation protein YunB [Clostridia bacterium]